MKKIIIIALMALVATTFFTGFTSVENSAADTVRPIQTLRQNWLIDSSLLFTPRDTNFTPSKPGIIWFQSAQNFYKWDGSKWSVLSSDTSSNDLSNYWTSTQVQNRLDDTAAAIRADFPTGGSTDLSAYSTTAQTKQLIGDTATTVRAAIPTSNGGLTNTAGYQTKDSLTAHAVTAKAPLIQTDTTLGIDTSIVVTNHWLDSVLLAETLQKICGRGNTYTGSIAIGTSTAPTHTLDVGGSAQFTGFVNFGNGYGNGGSTIDGTGDGQFPTVEADQITTPDMILSGIITTGALKNNASEDSVYAPDATGKMKLKFIGQVHALPDVPIKSLSGTSYTAALTDKDSINTITNSSAITVTIPPNSSVAFPIGTVLEYVQGGAGNITFSPGSGVTVGNAHSYTKSSGQYAICALRKINTDTWVLFGDLQ